MDVDERDDILLSDSDEATDAAPLDEPGAGGASRSRRGRGRPKGSGTGASGGGGGSGKRSAGGGGSRSRLAGVDDIADVLSKLLGTASAVLALALVGSDYAGAVALTKSEARDISEPAARLLRKSGLAQQASALALRGGDVVALVSALVGYSLRAGPMVAEIRAANRGAGVGPVGQTAQTGQSANGHFGASQVIRAQPAQPGHANGNGVNAFAGFTDSDANAANGFAGWDSEQLAAIIGATASD